MRGRGLLIKTAAESRRAFEAGRRRLLEGGERPASALPCRLSKFRRQGLCCRRLLWGSCYVNLASFSRPPRPRTCQITPGQRWAEAAGRGDRGGGGRDAD